MLSVFPRCHRIRHDSGKIYFCLPSTFQKQGVCPFWGTVVCKKIWYLMYLSILILQGLLFFIDLHKQPLHTIFYLLEYQLNWDQLATSYKTWSVSFQSYWITFSFFDFLSLLYFWNSILFLLSVLQLTDLTDWLLLFYSLIFLFTSFLWPRYNMLGIYENILCW